MRSEVVRDSKFLSFVLRHRPDRIGLDLDENGVWLTAAVPPAFLVFPA